jgi:hypothetical protein
MVRWASILTAIVIVAVTVVSPRFGFIGVVLALAAFAIVFWFSTIVDLLRTGPGVQREWWIGSLAVVVLLGPLGALAYRLAAPSFAREINNSLHQ